MRLSAATIRGGVIAAIALVVLGAASATPWVVTLTLPRFGRPETAESEPPQMTLAPQPQADMDPALTQAIERAMMALFVLVVAAIIGYGIYRLARRLQAAWRPDEGQVATDQLDGDVLGEVVPVDLASLATAVGRAEAHLAGIAEPGDAVIAAWVALEDEAALQGTTRDPAQTMTEFTTALLARTPAPPDAVAVLRGLYHRARFAAQPVTADDVQQARESLARIAGALDAEVAP